jgi:signal transduction histidine kinase
VSEIFSLYRDLIDRYEGVPEARTEIVVPVGKKERVFDLHISPLYHDHKNLAGRLIVLRDVTERARLIQELDAYAQTVAHDLKTPLTGIIGYVEMIDHFDKDQLSDEMRDYVNRIGESGRKMQSIIDELLLMASLRGMNDVKVETLDMSDIVTAAQRRHGHTLLTKHVEIVQPEHWPPSQGYAPWVEEVWSNYLSNAIKYGGEPPHIELGAAAQPDGMVRYWVHDNGQGLTAEQQTRLFQQFVRLDQTRANGHGLGLSIVRRIVEKQGGKVGVESIVGTGSTFYFTLPATASENGHRENGDA